MRQCKFCKKQRNDNKRFCGGKCINNYLEEKQLPVKTFRAYENAAQYLGVGIKTVRQFENIYYKIDKTLPNAQIIWKTCNICGKQSRSAKCKKAIVNNVVPKVSGINTAKLVKT